ncbi:transposase family protein [Actinomadura sp. 3N407]|uniref:transposase family protein n=1 Tax=Actinomadura sp. 3N407 TaxID=3457423 RepID=UPI003FCE4532
MTTGSSDAVLPCCARSVPLGLRFRGRPHPHPPSELGSRWRRLPAGRRALLVLVHSRRDDTFAGLAAAFGVGVATAHRYVTEVIDLLSDLAPDLRRAMRTAQRKAYIILDGTLVPTDRPAGDNDRLFYSGKHRRHGVNFQFLTDPHGELIRAPPALPADRSPRARHYRRPHPTGNRLLRRQGI